jgi:hypothetical protein
LDEEEVGAATEKKDKLIRGGEKRFCQSDWDLGEWNGYVYSIWNRKFCFKFFIYNYKIKHTPDALSKRYLYSSDWSWECHYKGVLYVIQRDQKHTDLDEAVITLAYSKVEHLFTIMHWLEHKKWNSNLALRVLYFFAIPVHHKQIVTNGSMKRTFWRSKHWLNQQRNEWPVWLDNMAALNHLKRNSKEEVKLGLVDQSHSVLQSSKRKNDGLISCYSLIHFIDYIVFLY